MGAGLGADVDHARLGAAGTGAKVGEALGQGPGPGAGYGPAGGRRGSVASQGQLTQAYAKLGLKDNASNSEVKKAYRKLVSQYHPDKLISRGLPEEMMEVAKTRVREINTAYNQIKQAKGFK